MKYGWCLTGHHDSCRVRSQRFYHGQKKVKRKTVQAVIMLDEWTECSCTCHLPEDIKPKKKPAKKAARRKK